MSVILRTAIFCQTVYNALEFADSLLREKLKFIILDIPRLKMSCSLVETI